jgi:hypothetical protein
MGSWNREKSLKIGRAQTRDGRDVINLREAVLDGRDVLVGDVATTKRKHYKNDQVVVHVESAYWEAGGLGKHGGDDLVNIRG